MVDRTRFPKVREIPCQEDAEELLLKEESVLQEIKNPSNTTHIFLILQEEKASSCRSLDQVMNCNDL